VCCVWQVARRFEYLLSLFAMLEENDAAASWQNMRFNRLTADIYRPWETAFTSVSEQNNLFVPVWWIPLYCCYVTSRINDCAVTSNLAVYMFTERWQRERQTQHTIHSFHSCAIFCVRRLECHLSPSVPVLSLLTSSYFFLCIHCINLICPCLSGLACFLPIKLLL